jgi:hypothetical protein
VNIDRNSDFFLAIGKWEEGKGGDRVIEVTHEKSIIFNDGTEDYTCQITIGRKAAR